MWGANRSCHLTLDEFLGPDCWCHSNYEHMKSMHGRSTPREELNTIHYYLRSSSSFHHPTFLNSAMLTLITITLLLATGTFATPYSPHILPRQNSVAGPCDPWSLACQPVRQSNACLAQFLNRANASVILRCVDDEDTAQAERDVS